MGLGLIFLRLFLKIHKNKKRIMVKKCAIGLYFFLWFITGTWGRSDVNRRFDLEFSLGNSGLVGTNAVPQSQPITRLPYSSAMRNIDYSQPPTIDLWRARSTGIAIAPFVIIDEAAWVNGGLSGFAGRRVVFWCFGASRWLPRTVFWVA